MSARAMIRARARAESRRRRRLAAGIAAAAAATVAASGSASAATIQVTNNNDSGAGSLRQAVADANVTKAADTITFASNVTGTITLTSGNINMKYDTTIDGPGRDVLTVRATALSGNDTLSASNIASASEVQTIEVEGLKLVSEDYRAFVGFPAIDSITIRNCELTGNSKFGGGGISDMSIPEFKVINSKITGSTAETMGAGIYAEDSNLTITDSEVTGNVNDNDDPGGGIWADDSTVTVENSRIAGNQAPGSSGGGIALVDSPGGIASSLTVRSSVVADNSAQLEGGGIAALDTDGPISISGSTISGNSSSGGGGGGLYVGYTGPVSVESSTFVSNASDTSGGGIWAFGPKGSFAVRNTTLTGNSANDGGAINWTNYYDEPGTVSNSTIVGNSAAADGGGIFRYGFDGVGPPFDGADDLVLTSTVVGDNAVLAPGPALGPDLGQPGSPSGSFIVDHSLIGSTQGGATITDGGSNKLNAGAPGVGPLADNGGPTQTMLPDPAGPLVDSGAANGLTVDQRGRPRTQQKPPADAAGSDGTDIGAAELDDGEVISPFAKAAKKQKVKGKVQVVVEVGAGEASTATGSGTVKLGKKKFPLATATGQITAGGQVELKLKPASKKAGKKIANALKKGKKAKANVEVTIEDAAGNGETTKLGVTLKSKKKQPK